jgi:hypothetical protein
VIAATRTVHQLRLRGRDRAGVQRAALLLEDALRTASLPDRGGRLLLVRRLALAPIDTEAPPQTVALALERRVAPLAAAAVHGGAAGAEAAPAVWFHDHLDAVTRLALVLAEGRSPGAWYWALAVPSWRPTMSLPQALRALAHDLAARPEAPTALPAWTAALAAAGHAETLATALEAVDVPLLARYAGLSPPLPAAMDRAAPNAAAEGLGARTAAVDPRWLLICRLLDAAGVPGKVPAQRAGTSIFGQRPKERPSTPPATGRMPPPGTARARSAGASAKPATSAPLSTADAGAAVQQVQPGMPPMGAGSPAALRPRSGRVGSPDARWGTSASAPALAAAGTRRFPGTAVCFDFSGQPTAAGGLLFLIPVLVHLGYPDWLAEHPEWAHQQLPHRLFARLLKRLEIAPADPAWGLAPVATATRRPPRHFVAPQRWHTGLTRGRGPLRRWGGSGAGCLTDASGHLPLGAWRGTQPRPLVPLLRTARGEGTAADTDLVALATAAWLTACRRWLRRFARTGLADLVRRPAEVALSRTHADLVFDHRQADLRLRRAGLDLDPGWVPWMGRVVTYHYVQRGRP